MEQISHLHQTDPILLFVAQVALSFLEWNPQISVSSDLTKMELSGGLILFGLLNRLKNP